jgi:hypothetical protein
MHKGGSKAISSYYRAMGRAQGQTGSSSALLRSSVAETVEDLNTKGFDAVFGERRGRPEALVSEEAVRIGAPATLAATLLVYQPGTMNSGLKTFDKQTSTISPLKTKIGSKVDGHTFSGTLIRQMKPASRPPGPNNPKAMRKKDFERLWQPQHFPDDVREFVEGLSETQPVKLYSIFHQGKGDTIFHAYLVADEDDFFIRSFTRANPASEKVLAACAPYLARRP